MIARFAFPSWGRCLGTRRMRCSSCFCKYKANGGSFLRLRLRRSVAFATLRQPSCPSSASRKRAFLIRQRHLWFRCHLSRCGSVRLGSDSPPDCHSLPRRAALPVRGRQTIAASFAKRHGQSLRLRVAPAPPFTQGRHAVCDRYRRRATGASRPIAHDAGPYKREPFAGSCSREIEKSRSLYDLDFSVIAWCRGYNVVSPSLALLSPLLSPLLSACLPAA